MHEEQMITVNGLNIHLIPTTKYKTATLVLQIKTKLSKETATKRALLANVLQSATNEFPSRKQIRLYLDELYGATFQTDVQRKGENHVITMRMESANERFLKEAPPLFKKNLSFLRNALEDPYLKEGKFSEKVIKEEKRTLKQRIQSIYDDKMRYANKRLLEVMCKNEPFSVHPYGDFEEVDAITADDLMDEYKRMLEEDDIRLYIVGDLKAEEVKEAASIFTKAESKADDTTTLSASEPNQSQEKIETDDIQQGKLHMGYRTPITFSDNRFPAAQVMNGLFGGFPNSKLFINVREKESMAYYAASRYESQKGIILVMAGIEVDNYNKAVNIIKKQLEDIKQGNIADEDVEQTKGMVKNQLLETADNARGLIELYYQGVNANHNRSLEDWLSAIDAVTKEDVVQSASTVELDTIYFLRSEEDNNDGSN
ncbi:putative Zn-dependent peptidase [Salibacterium salarium]|uniref:EF-P 5-aminopentanol modification-associated protein YfmF n=1 Tax=Salibacterium salarium TaxID=284579 RepID=UPI00278B3DC1|nr:pitrilysin family protein [Salibacterium salarium]MDQ0299193.1 putative Zn-dependent peptidase [Salibacterium salarium]